MNEKELMRVIQEKDFQEIMSRGFSGTTSKANTPNPPPSHDSVYGLISQLVIRELLISKYTALGFKVPEFITSEIEALTRRAKAKYQDDLEVRLAEVKKKAEDLKSKERQREEAEKEIAELEGLLGGGK